jgi:hypothetical protein
LEEDEALVKPVFVPALPDDFGAFPALLDELAVALALPDDLPVAALDRVVMDKLPASLSGCS